MSTCFSDVWQQHSKSYFIVPRLPKCLLTSGMWRRSPSCLQTTSESFSTSTSPLEFLNIVLEQPQQAFSLTYALIWFTFAQPHFKLTSETWHGLYDIVRWWKVYLEIFEGYIYTWKEYLEIFEGYIYTWKVKLEIFEGYIYTIMIGIIMRLMGHNRSQLLLRTSQVHMINETWDDWFNMQCSVTTSPI